MEKSDQSFDVIVVGGGAAGLMAAGRAAERGNKVLLLEKNRTLGKKLKITGGGRCNITNAELDERAFLKHYGAAEQFLYSAFSHFGVNETFSFFEKKGLPLVVQESKRAFPHTQRAYDVYAVLEKYIRAGKVMVKAGSPVTGVRSEAILDAGKGAVRITGVLSRDREYKARSFIFATGGVSHPQTGSTGEGFSWLEKLGHKVVKPTPTIVPLVVKDKWVKKLKGVSLSLMKITFFVDGVRRFSKTGNILFTHFGLSGPLILNAAHEVSELLHNGVVTALIDAFLHDDLGALDSRVVSLFDRNKNKMLKNVLKDIAPAGTAEAILSLVEPRIDADKKVHSVTQEERKRLVHLMKALPVTISGLMGYGWAVIADGGVTLTEIDMKTMRSKKVENLYIVGDLLHVNRPSGGYSLQLCWTTGYVAGNYA